VAVGFIGGENRGILITPLVFSNSSYIFMCTSINGIDDENNNKKKQKIGHTNLQQK
jgi:hypothetical protein